MKKNLILYVFIYALFLTGCSSNYDKYLGDWVIDRAYQGDIPLIWDLYTNGFRLKTDHTCQLPLVDYYDKGTDREGGVWSIKMINDSLFLKISTQNEVFNRTFLIKEYREVIDSNTHGILYHMRLESDSLTLECTKDILGNI